MNEGFVKLLRRIRDWEWYDRYVEKDILIELLLIANWKEKTWKGIKIERGQAVTGRKKLAAKLGFSEQQIRTGLSNLQKTGEITIKSTNKFSIITVCSWDTYNSEEDQDQPTNQPTDNQQTHHRDNHQTTTTKKDKNIRNKNYTVDELRMRLIQMFTKRVSIPRDPKEDAAWNRIKAHVTADDVQFLEKFYKLPKSNEMDPTWNRKTTPAIFFNNFSSQLDLARSYFQKKKKTSGDFQGIPEAGGEII